MTLSVHELYAIAEIIARQIHNITNEWVDIEVLVDIIQHNEDLNQIILSETYDLNHFFNLVKKSRKDDILTWYQKIIISRNHKQVIDSFIETHTEEEQNQMVEHLNYFMPALVDLFMNQMNLSMNEDKSKRLKR